jgi:hypothetical protein
VREEVLEGQFTELLGRLCFDDEVLAWVREALLASHADKRREQEEAIARLRAEFDRLQKRLDAMYVDKLDGRVDAALFDKLSAEWRVEQDCCQRETTRHQEADKSYMDEDNAVLHADNPSGTVDHQGSANPGVPMADGGTVPLGQIAKVSLGAGTI